MSSLNVLHEIRENTKSAQTLSQVKVKYISARNTSSGTQTMLQQVGMPGRTSARSA